MKDKMDLKKIPRGEIGGVPVFTKLKVAMLELLKGYPLFRYYGIFESYFEGVPGHEVVKILEDDDFIDVIREKDKQPLYRITPKGIDLTISMVNLDYSEETSKYNRNMRKFTIAIIILTIINSIPILIKFVQWLISHGISA